MSAKKKNVPAKKAKKKQPSVAKTKPAPEPELVPAEGLAHDVDAFVAVPEQPELTADEIKEHESPESLATSAGLTASGAEPVPVPLPDADDDDDALIDNEQEKE